MGYKFHGQCYETLYDFHVAFAQECFKVAGSGLATNMLSCTADSGGYVVMQSYNIDQGTSGTPWNYTPQQISCTYEPPKVFSNADVVELSWLVVGVWVIAWGIKKLSEVMKLR